MPSRYSQRARTNLNATSAIEPLLVLLEIAHPLLAEPVRVVDDTQDITVEGHLFQSCGFRVGKADDVDGQAPRAQLEVDNIGRELTTWLEQSGGGVGATARMMEVMRSTPDIVEFDVTFDMTSISVNQTAVSAQLGFDDILNQPAVTVRYDPLTAPGQF